MIDFDNTYARDLEGFYTRTAPTPVAVPHLILFNRALADELGLAPEAAEAAVLTGNRIPPGAEPLAMAYAGHQFGQFVPQLGDGRALLLGEVVDRRGRRRDIQLKGAGPTPFSRRGDGRAALGPVLREYLISEAMHALGIPTTRALAAAATGEPVYRETVLPGAVFTRVAASHIRVGTFQFFAVRNDIEAVKRLADYVIARLYPEIAGADQPYLALLDAVMARQAALIAQWMHVGFIHGVMNTDNMAVSGETIDFGPCAFIDAYDPATVFSSIDEMGRYAYGNQPAIAQWNLARFAETLLPLIGPDRQRAIDVATERIKGFPGLYMGHWLSGMGRKLGLVEHRHDDLELVHAWLDLLQANHADFTLSFRYLADALEGREGGLRSLFADQAGLDRWLGRWRTRMAQEAQPLDRRAASMRRVNPLFIPRNHRVEEALAAAVGDGELAPLNTLLDVLSRPFAEQPGAESYAVPPEPGLGPYRTFCGT